MTWLPAHRSHDHTFLMQRWRRVATAAGLRWHVIASAAGLPIITLESLAAQRGESAAYLSAGVHGDEPAAVCGLLQWAEKNLALLRQRAFLIIPCFNPRGLLLNTRADHRGLDLNRRFHLADDEVCGPWFRFVTGRAMLGGLCLHEDYDGHGLYVYELGHHREAISHNILRECSGKMPIDPRRNMDGRVAIGGVIRRRKVPADLPGMPEAIVLHQLGCPVTLTFETPSEFALDDRAAAHQRFITAALRRFFK